MRFVKKSLLFFHDKNRAIIDYRFLTTEKKIKSFVYISLFVPNLISKAICSDCRAVTRVGCIALVVTPFFLV